nr:hypothetical protein [Nostoc sp. EkiNYC01]
MYSLPWQVIENGKPERKAGAFVSPLMVAKRFCTGMIAGSDLLRSHKFQENFPGLDLH